MAHDDNIGPELIKALVALQKEAKPIKPNALNKFLKNNYVNLLGLYRETKDLVASHGLAVSQMPSNIDGKSALRTIVMHDSGQYLQDTLPIELPSTRDEEKYDKESGRTVTKVIEADSQDQGAAITHLRRYAYMAALGLVSDDNEPYASGDSAVGKMGFGNAPKASTTNPPSPAQISMIQRLASERGVTQEQLDERMKTIKSAADASEAIGNLKRMA